MTTSPKNTPTASDAWMGWLALAYLVALFLAVPLHGKLLLADLAAPMMLCQLWRKREDLLDFLLAEGKWLALAFAWMTIAVASQFARGNGTLYDLAVFGYMAVIFCFFRVTPLPNQKVCRWSGLTLIGLCLLGWLATKLAPQAPLIHQMLYTDLHFQQLEPNQLVTRYQFLFDNPNLLGSAYLLPVILLLPALQERLRAVTRWSQAIALACLCLLACLPLFATASKHLVMTFGVLAGSWTVLPLLPKRLTVPLAATAVALFGLLCLITVIFQTYPALQQAPWVDFSLRGNYSVHQEIYAKIIARNGLGGVLLGHSPAELHELYPKFADAEKIHDILEPYGFAGETQLFATFMDPHQEYLNFWAFFGAPALLALLAFLYDIARNAIRNARWETALFVLGLLLAFCWDDLGSKRWIWAALACLATRQPNELTDRIRDTTIQPTTQKPEPPQ